MILFNVKYKKYNRLHSDILTPEKLDSYEEDEKIKIISVKKDIE